MAILDVATDKPLIWILSALLLAWTLPPVRRCCFALACFLHRKWMAILCLQQNQARARAKFLYFRVAFQQNIYFQRWSLRKLSEATSISLWRLQILHAFPWYIPTHRNLRRLATAFLLPFERFQRETSYTPELTKLRLDRYIELGVEIHLKRPIRELSQRQKAVLLNAIEAQLMRDFEDEGKVLR